MNEYLRPATFDDIVHVWMDMRQDDQDECYAFGMTPWTALNNGLQNSVPCFAVIEPDTKSPVAICGVSRNSFVWLLGTNNLDRYPMTLLRNSKRGLNDLYKYSERDKLYNFVSAKNHLHIKWIRWLGFRMYETPVIFNGLPFYYFEKVIDKE